MLCGKAPGDLFRIGARALQGVGSGIIQSLGLAIVTREFRPEQRGLALGLWAMAAAASISFGPLLGGYLVDAYSWHRLFDVNVPVGVFAILLSAFLQHEWKSPAPPQAEVDGREAETGLQDKAGYGAGLTGRVGHAEAVEDIIERSFHLCDGFVGQK